MKKKLDEMEKTIKLRSQSLGFKVGVLLLAIWTIYESYLGLSTGQKFSIIPCLILTVTLNVPYFAELVLKRKMIAGDDEYREPNKVILTIIGIAVFVVITISIGSFILLSIN